MVYNFLGDETRKLKILVLTVPHACKRNPVSAAVMCYQ